jgi:uncharacterized membrane protein YkvA (DUF1232 family)
MSDVQDPSQYSESSFWTKVKKFAKTAGKEVIEKALFLYYAAQQPSTPLWAKTTIYGALAYFISPIDALPDLTPVLGYTDDLGILAAALVTVATYITDEVKQKAKDRMQTWFGSTELKNKE